MLCRASISCFEVSIFKNTRLIGVAQTKNQLHLADLRANLAGDPGCGKASIGQCIHSLEPRIFARIIAGRRLVAASGFPVRSCISCSFRPFADR